MSEQASEPRAQGEPAGEPRAQGEPASEPGAQSGAAFAAVLASWWEGARRDLPWRRTRDPWAILVAEAMLQQTQVPRVAPRYRAFLDRFPDPAACARAGVAAVIDEWAGLGYYRRAVAVHAAAVAVVERHAGVVPDTLEALLALPGIGPYTARAVLAFAYERDVGVVDTNAARVLARAVAGRPLRRAESQDLADRLVGAGRGWAHNQAMLDLGARHCRPRPDCGRCPAAAVCRWAAAGFPDPDPAVGSAGVSVRQAAFAGSDRQGRGRLVAAARTGRVGAGEVAAVAGWPDDPARAGRVADALVRDGLVERDPDGGLRLPSRRPEVRLGAERG